jgi:small subunit ribosomal protein S8
MSMNDPLGDMLTRIRNAQMRGKSTVSTPASTLRARVLDVLKSEGYIRGYEKVRHRQRPGRIRDRAEVLRRRAGDPRRSSVSRSPAAASMGVKSIPSVRNGLGVSIVSTPKGVMSDANARAANVGGEVLCTVF